MDPGYILVLYSVCIAVYWLGYTIYYTVLLASVGVPDRFGLGPLTTEYCSSLRIPWGSLRTALCIDHQGE